MTTIKEIATAGEFGDYKLIFGYDGANWRPILIDSSGNLQMELGNLEKAEDAAHTSADKGIMALAVRKDNVGSLCDADGEYTPLILNEHGVLRTQAQQHYHIDECEAITGWSVLGNDTINLAVTTNHVCGTLALEFDKVNGAANTKIAGIQKTITSFDFTPYHKGGGFALASCYLSSLTSVDYCFLRLGTDASNYTEWRCDADDLNERWNLCRHTACNPSATVGNGWNSAAITYVAIGVAFEVETDELADIAVDHLAANTGLITSIPVEAAKNINLLKIKNKVVDVGAGNVSTGTQRITVAGDDANLLAIKTALQIIDDWDDGSDRCNVSKSFRDAAGVGRRMLVDADRHGQVDVLSEAFSGAFYSKNFTAPDAAAEAPIEAAEKKLKDVVINNTHDTYEAEFRKAAGDWVEIAPGRSTGFTLIDLNTIYVKAQTDGQNPVLDIWGVEP